MKIVAYSDPHSHEHKRHSWISGHGVNSRVEDITTAVQVVYDYADSINAPTVFGGDMFQIKGSVAVNGFNGIFDIIRRRGLRTAPVSLSDLMIPGNHDMSTTDGSKHALEPFANRRNVIATAPMLHSMGDNVTIAALPFPMENGKFSDRKFVANYKMLVEGLSSCAPGHRKILLSHCYTHELMAKHHGVSGDVTGKDLLVDFDVVLLGHHHIHDVIHGDDGRKVVSIGSMIQHTFNDVGEVRGFVVLDTETLEIEHIPIESRKFWAFTGESEISETKAAGSFVRVRVATKVEGERVRKKLESAGAASIVIEVIPVAVKTSRLDLEAGSKDEDIIQKYLDSEWCTTTLDKPELKKRAGKYLSKAGG
ncbi:MAG: hypothetical protein JEZ11_17920 [Desulfobacterales bacterium]|nr:hypothetical protein [Desulfobacterales bacterium]